ncbi:MAG: F0F1 ATP synthase subunit C, partial [Alphaproteobacteria bacterium]|nr:F0F1 ATP synthase subunit C [Alphaproteobacteria bacterium]
SVLAAGLCFSIGGVSAGFWEGHAAASALQAIAQQPDEANTITRTLFVAMAMVESTAIYSFVITILILYFNPFWNYAIQIAAK